MVAVFTFELNLVCLFPHFTSLDSLFHYNYYIWSFCCWF